MAEAIASKSASPVMYDGWTFAARGDGAVRIVSPSGELVNLTAKQWYRVAASLRPASRLMEGAGLAESTHERYWSKVALPGANGCMLWTAGLDRAGYGQFQRGDRTLKAHQISWWFAYGPLASGLVLDHLCQVRACVAPYHLEAVTQAENARRVGSRSEACRRGHRWDEQEPIQRGSGRECRICRNQGKRLRYELTGQG